MGSEHVKATDDKATGAVKDAPGKLIGSEHLQAEGKMNKAKGDLHKVAKTAPDTAPSDVEIANDD